MAKKRGGLAGLYDRNKGIIQTAAPIAAGMFGGPLAGAAVGAAIRGLDREGKSGIGFDAKQGLAGGVSGYGGGSMGAGLKNMFTGQLAKRAALKGAGKALEATKGVADIAIPNVPAGMGAAASAAPSAAGGGFNAAQYMADDLVSQVPSKAMTLGKGVSTTNPGAKGGAGLAGKIPAALKTKEGLAFAGNALQTGAGILGSQAQAAQQEREYEDQQRQLQARAEMLAMFAPQMAGNLGMQFGGAGAPTASFQQYANSAADLGTNDPRVMREERGEPIVYDGRIIGYNRRAPVGNTRTSGMTGSEYMDSYGGTPQAQRISADAAAAGRDYMATGFGGSDRAKQLAAEAAARGRNYTYGRR